MDITKSFLTKGRMKKIKQPEQTQQQIFKSSSSDSMSEKKDIILLDNHSKIEHGKFIK